MQLKYTVQKANTQSVQQHVGSTQLTVDTKMITGEQLGRSDTAKKLCITRTIIGTSSKCNIQETKFSSFTLTSTVLSDLLENI